MPRSKIITYNTVLKTSKIDAFTPILVFPVSQVPHTTRVRAQIFTSLISLGAIRQSWKLRLVIIIPYAGVSPLRQEGSRKQAVEKQGLCHVPLTQPGSWQCWWPWWTILEHWAEGCSLQDTLLLAYPKYLLQRKWRFAPWANWSNLCFVWALVYFLFLLFFLMIKAAFDMSTALKDECLLFLPAPLFSYASVHPWFFLLCFCF